MTQTDARLGGNGSVIAGHGFSSTWLVRLGF